MSFAWKELQEDKVNHPEFKNRLEAISYWKYLLAKEDDKLQEEIKYRLRRMDEIRANIRWNLAELKREREAAEQAEGEEVDSERQDYGREGLY